MIISTKQDLHNIKIENYELVVAVHIMHEILHKEDFDIIIKYSKLEYLEIYVNDDEVIKDFFSSVVKFIYLQTFIYHNYKNRWYDNIYPPYFYSESNLIINNWKECNCNIFCDKCESCNTKHILDYNNYNIKNMIIHVISNNFGYLLNNLPINLERLQINISNDKFIFSNLPVNLKNLDILIGYGFEGNIKNIISNIKVPFNCRIQIFHKFQIDMDNKKEKFIFLNTKLLYEK